MDPIERLGWKTDAGVSGERAANARATENRMDLDDVLDDKPPEVEKPAEQTENVSSKQAFREKEQVAQEAGRARDPETGKFVPKEEKPVEEAKPVQEMTQKERAFLAKATDESRKRQELEQRYRELETRFQQMHVPQQPQDEPKTFWDDPEGAFKKWQTEVQKEKQEIQRTAVNARLDAAEFVAKGRHPDFQEKVEVFKEVIQKTPGLAQQWLGAQDPAEFAYQVGKQYSDLQQLGSIEAMKSQIEKETRLRVEAEYKAKAEAEAKQRSSLPGSLTDVHSVGVNKPVWGGPTSLDNVLKS